MSHRVVRLKKIDKKKKKERKDQSGTRKEHQGELKKI